MREAELNSEKKSSNIIEKFVSLKKHKLRDLDEQPDKSLLLEEFEKELFDAVDILENEIMELEMHLQQALQNAMESFSSKASNVNNVM